MRKLVGAALALSAMTGIARADAVVFDDGTLDRITAGAPATFFTVGTLGTLGTPTGTAGVLPLLVGLGLAPAPADPDEPTQPIPPTLPTPPILAGKITPVAANGTTGFAACQSSGTCTNTAFATANILQLQSQGSN